MNVKELLVWRRYHIWNLSDSNKIWTHNHLVCKQAPNHLAKLVKWLGCVVSTYLYSAFLTVCYYHVAYKFQSESTLCSLHECQGAPCLKQVPYLKFKWQWRDSNPQPPSSETNTQPFSQTDQISELCCEHLSVRCIWLYVIVMSSMSLRLNLHSIVCLNVKELLARSKRHIWSLNDNKIQTHNNLVCKWTLNHLAKLAKWLSCVVSTYLCNAIRGPPPPFLQGGGGTEPLTKFSKREGAWQDLSF